MQGQLFTQDFLQRGIQSTPPWQALSEDSVGPFKAALAAIFAALPAGSTINEAQTEQLVIQPVLRELGWADDTLPQVNLSPRQREDVPDQLLFADAASKARALTEKKDDRRYQHGLAILEAKRWGRPLDRGESADPHDPGAPSSQGQHLNWFIVEQLPVIAPERIDASIGGVKIADFIREQVPHLSYTAHDLAAFARDLGHVDAAGEVLPPFVWNDEDRRARLAALDGLFFHLYGLDEDDAAYILDTFPIVREQDQAAFGR
jgi:hypothetical protein